MSLKNRVKNLEKRAGIDEGLIYFVMVADGVYTLKVNGSDVLQDVDMTEKEFTDWENTRGENDDIYVISRNDYQYDYGDDEND